MQATSLLLHLIGITQQTHQQSRIQSLKGHIKLIKAELTEQSLNRSSNNSSKRRCNVSQDKVSHKTLYQLPWVSINLVPLQHHISPLLFSTLAGQAHVPLAMDLGSPSSSLALHLCCPVHPSLNLTSLWCILTNRTSLRACTSPH